MQEIRITKALNDERHTTGMEGVFINPYFQFGYFESDYFQTGLLQISSNTDRTTSDKNLIRFTVRLD